MIKFKRKDIQKAKGITLIALVVTIVVLLILAAVSISMLAGEDGIVRNAQRAKDSSEEASEKETLQIAVNAAMIDGENGIIGLTQSNLENALEDEGLTKNTEFKVEPGDTEDSLKVTFLKTGRVYEVDKNGKVSDSTKAEQGGGGGSNTLQAGEKATATKNNYNGVTIPEGFTVSGNTNEGEESKGIVIYRIDDNATVNWNDDTSLENAKQSYDQFVWVPVEEAYIKESALASYTGSNNYEKLQNYCSTNSRYPMAIKVGNDFKGILYTFSGTTSVTITPMDYTTTSAYREPAYLNDSSFADASSYNNVGITQSPDSLQTEFNTMVTSVNTNGGFWVGRYETSNMNNNESNDSTQQIMVKKGTTTGINSVNWYRMYAQQKNYANKVGISKTSSMIWGSQWDQIMIWMRNVENKTTYAGTTPFYVINARGMGNYSTSAGGTGSLAATGYFDVKNIYDLARKCL